MHHRLVITCTAALLICCVDASAADSSSSNSSTDRHHAVSEILVENKKAESDIRSTGSTSSVERKLDLLLKLFAEHSVQPRDCFDLLKSGVEKSGVYMVYIAGRPVDVYCDMSTDGGGWTVFQRRQDGSENFYRSWNDYAAGFGKACGEMWLGNEFVHRLVSGGRRYRLRIDLGDFHGSFRYAEYSNFVLASACEKYKLSSLGKYSGNAGNSLTPHLGMKFSTHDQDNDMWSSSCAVQYKGAWWYNICHSSNLNGLYLRGPHKSHADSVVWASWTGAYYSLKFTEMKIKPTNV